MKQGQILHTYTMQASFPIPMPNRANFNAAQTRCRVISAHIASGNTVVTRGRRNQHLAVATWAMASGGRAGYSDQFVSLGVRMGTNFNIVSGSSPVY